MSQLHGHGPSRATIPKFRSLKSAAINPDEVQSKRFTRRSLMLGAGGIGLFGLLAGKLYNLQGIEGRKYKSLAEDNRLATRFLLSRRGRIFDRSRTPIDSNAQNLSILLIPEQAKNIAA